MVVVTRQGGMTVLIDRSPAAKCSRRGLVRVTKNRLARIALQGTQF